ncbi:MAG TPA: Npt1/Npt2 family nucleotide transporter [Acidobacteriota bacterium]|nr:Npt1/Npt2 family nucleotide transporter [Acidobacteriota bacterium]
MSNPLRTVFDFDRRELPVAVLLFFFFFLVIAVFQILKPLKNGLFVEHYGAGLELYAKLGNIVVAALGVMFFTWLYNRLRRDRLIYFLSGFFIACFALMIWALADPEAWSIWSFYFLGDLETTLMVAAFWAYATDLSSTDQAKRLFGVIGGGGVIGGWVGISVAKLLLAGIGMVGLLVLSSGFMLAVVVITAITERLVRKSGRFRLPGERAPETKSAPKGRSQFSVALDGARLVAGSSYLLAIAGIMASYEIASQVMDYQFKLQTEALEGVTNTQAFMTNVYFFANLLSVVVQFFVVSLVIRKFGLKPALLVLPIALLASSTAFMMVPTLIVSSLLVISDNGLNYSIQQTARESLYLVTSRDEKYAARAFTNMFVQRFAKGIGIVGVLGLGLIGLAARWLSVITILAMVVMISASLYAARVFAARSAEEQRREVAELTAVR